MSGAPRVLARPFAVAILGLCIVGPMALAHDGGIQVTFHGDNGFTVTSDKDISNVIVELCDGTMHKHEPIDETSYHHEESQGVVGVWVKAGNNHNEDEDAPRGAGERFDNDGVDCDQAPEPTPPPPTTSEPAPSSEPPAPSGPAPTSGTSEPAPPPGPTTTSTSPPPSEDCAIEVTFQSDTHFSVTSCKDISNVIVELCDGTMHKHELHQGQTFDHEETQGVVGVWVKAGDNHNEDENAPSGAGERFDNDGVVCDEAPSTTQPPPTTSAPPPATTGPVPSTPPNNNGPPGPPPATTGTTNPPATEPPAETPPPTLSAPDTTNPTPTTPIPVFPSAAAVALATIGALGGGFLILRRR